MKKYFYFFLFFSFITCFSQQIKKEPAQVMLLARAQKDRILLRWGVTQAPEWKKTNQYGFSLKKFVYKRDGKILPVPEPVTLPQNVFKPAGEAEWKKIIDKDQNAAIIAGSIYGESFAMEGPQTKGDIAKIVNTAEELQQRFAFGLMAADFSFEGAKLAGWAYVDVDVKWNEEYIYQVASLVPKDKAFIKESSALISLKDYKLLPDPLEFQGVFQDRTVIMAWNYDMLRSVYNSYNIEKSEDGVNFAPISKIPMVNMNDKPDNPAQRMYYVDSLKVNNKNYYYRLYGKTSFGEQGPYTKVISGKGVKTLVFIPYCNDYTFTKNQNEAIVKWEYPKEGEQDITSFAITQSEKDEGPYKLIAEKIPVTQREQLLKNLEPTNYIKVIAVGKNNQLKESFSKLIQPIDSIPPVAPIELVGKIDSTGVVKLNWKANVEKDLLGYKIFRANQEKEEFYPLNQEVLATTNFQDSVVVKSLNRKVYYKIIALDKRFNESKFSQIIVVEKPDVIAPSSPIFVNYKVESGKVKLQWEKGSEPNQTIKIYRENLSDKLKSEEIFSTTDSIKSYVDLKVEKNKEYRYSIQSISKTGLKSLSSTPLTVNVVDLTLDEAIKSFEGSADRERKYIELRWTIDEKKQVVEYTLYKNTAGQKPVTWKILPANIKNILDEDIKPSITYTYTLKATLNNGQQAKIKTLTIQY